MQLTSLVSKNIGAWNQSGAPTKWGVEMLTTLFLGKLVQYSNLSQAGKGTIHKKMFRLTIHLILK